MKYTKSNIYVAGSLFKYNPKNTANLSSNYTIGSGALNGLNPGVVSLYFKTHFAGRSFQTSNADSGGQLIPLSDYFQLDATLATILAFGISLQTSQTN